MKTWIAAMLLVGAGSAQARLGETNVDVAKRYGPVQSREVVSTNEWRGSYSFKEYRVEVVFSNEVSVAEFIQPKVKRRFSADEKKALIETVGGAGDWETLFGDVWVNPATKARAQIDFIAGRQQLLVMTRGYYDNRKSQEKAKAEGF